MNPPPAANPHYLPSPAANSPARAMRGGVWALVVGAIALGLAPIFVRVSEVGPSATAFWRLALACPVLGMMSLASSQKLHGRVAEKTKGGGGMRSVLGLPALAGAFFAGDLVLWHRSIHHTAVANATLLTNLSVIFVPLSAWLLFSQKMTRRFILALTLALAGTLLLAGKDAHFSAQTLNGDGLAILSAFFYTGYILTIKAARDRGQRTSSIMATSAFVTAACILPIALLSGEQILPKTALGWGAMIGLAGIVQLAGQSLVTNALAQLPAAMVSLGLLLQPATATLVAWVWLHESLSLVQFVGGVVLLCGLMLARPR